MTESNIEVNRFCGKCGASLPSGVSFCTKCGASVTDSTPAAPISRATDWREQRYQMRAERRAERYSRPGPHIGALILATILIVMGLSIFFPSLPWQVFWGSLLIIFGLWIVYLYATRG